MTPRYAGVACCLALVACGRSSGEPQRRPAPAPVASSSTTPLPSSATSQPSLASDAPVPAVDLATFSERDGTQLAIRLRNGLTVRLQGLRRSSPGEMSAAQCAVDADGRRLATVGVGATEQYTCTGLVAAGAMPLKNGAPRIGLIYEVESPNASFRTAVVLEQASGAWRVDDELAGEFDGIAAGRSIAGLRAALAKRDAGTL